MSGLLISIWLYVYSLCITFQQRQRNVHDVLDEVSKLSIDNLIVSLFSGATAFIMGYTLVYSSAEGPVRVQREPFH